MEVLTVPMIAGEEQNEEMCQFFAVLIKTASMYKRIPKWWQWLLVSSHMAMVISGLALSANIYPDIALIEVHLSDLWVVALAVVLIFAFITSAQLTLAHNRSVTPIRQVMKRCPIIALAKTMKFAHHVDREVLEITGRDDSFVCTKPFNPADAKLVRYAYEVVHKRPPKITNLLDKQ